MADQTSRNGFFKKVIRGILFVAAAIPGLFIFLWSLIFFLFSAVVPDTTFRLSDFWLPLLALPVGGALILLGIGDFRKWPYLSVFVSFPVLAVFFGSLEFLLGWNGGGKGEFYGEILLAGFASYLVFRKIDKYYKATRIAEG